MKHSAQQSVMQAAYIPPMEPLEEKHPHRERPYRLARRAKLAILISEAGGLTQLARISGTPKSHLSAISSGDRGMGDDLAAKLESVMDKPDGWMDDPETGPMFDSHVLYASEPDDPYSLGIAVEISRYMSSLDNMRQQMALTLFRYLLDNVHDTTRVEAVQAQLDALQQLT